MTKFSEALKELNHLADRFLNNEIILKAMKFIKAKNTQTEEVR